MVEVLPLSLSGVSVKISSSDGVDNSRQRVTNHGGDCCDIYIAWHNAHLTAD